MVSVSVFQPLTSHAVTMALSTNTLGRTLHIVDEIPSTNSALLALAQEGAPDGTVIVAEAQTSGRGRRGRPWHSPPGKNLYCSILMRRTLPPDRISAWLSWAPLLSAVSVARAIQVVSGVRPSLKWPNDVLIEHRKVGGLLCESNGTGTTNLFVIVGIGVNVNMWRDSFPDDLRDSATSLAAEAGRPFDRAVLLATLLSELEVRYEMFFAGAALDIRHEYGLRCSTIGQQVRVDLASGESVTGRADSIGEDGSLRVVRDSTHGASIDIRAGDVVHLRKDVNR